MSGYCQSCLEKQRKIDRLEETVSLLRARLRYQERVASQEGFFGSSTPSSKIPLKANTLAERQMRRGGARPGHVGHGRKALSDEAADQVETISVKQSTCPDCGVRLKDNGLRRRTVVDCEPIRKQVTLYHLRIKRCPHCHRTFQARPPGVLPKSLYGNQLLTHIAVQHYLYGTPLGRLEEQTGIGYGSLIDALHRLGVLLSKVPDRLLKQYRRSVVKHADETGWRTDGQNGYAWLFCTDQISLFRFRQTRSASVPKEVFGETRLGGVLVVDRYNAYNKVPCAIQYCYAHLLREVEDLEREFPENSEIQSFGSVFGPLLAQAMTLRSLSIQDGPFYRQAHHLRQQILEAVHREAKHPGIHRIQGIFRENQERLYQWVENRQVPAENNRAERELRPLVIARKVSFGSQSQAGAKTRETLMTVLCTLRKRFPDFQARFKNALDQLALNPQHDPYQLLFHSHSPP